MADSNQAMRGTGADGMGFLPVDLDALPEWMTAERRWLVWDERHGAGRKAARGSSTDESTWLDFETARMVYEKDPSACGLGWVLTGSDIGCLDGDGVFDADTGALDSTAQGLLADLAGSVFTELSPGGRGVHVFFRLAEGDSLAEGHVRLSDQAHHGWDLYPPGSKRFICVTGRQAAVGGSRGDRLSGVAVAQVEKHLGTLQAGPAEPAAGPPGPPVPDPVLDWLFGPGVLVNDSRLDARDDWIRVGMAMKKLGQDAGREGDALDAWRELCAQVGQQDDPDEVWAGLSPREDSRLSLGTVLSMAVGPGVEQAMRDGDEPAGAALRAWSARAEFGADGDTGLGSGAGSSAPAGAGSGSGAGAGAGGNTLRWGSGGVLAPVSVHGPGVAGGMGLPPRPWLYGHMLALGDAHAVGGPGGVSKSTWVMLTLLSVTVGRDLLDTRSDDQKKSSGAASKLCWYGRGPGALLINFDDRQRDVLARLEGMRREYGLGWSDMDRLVVQTREDLGPGFRLVEDVGGGACRWVRDAWAWLAGVIVANDIWVWCGDPMVSLMGGLETGEAWAAFFDGLSWLQAEVRRRAPAGSEVGKHGVSVVLVHHTRKASAGGDGSAPGGAGDGFASDALRGSGVLRDLCRGVTVIQSANRRDMAAVCKARGWQEPSDQELRELVLLDPTSKANYASRWGLQVYRLKGVGLGNSDAVHDQDVVGVPVEYVPSARAGLSVADQQVLWDGIKNGPTGVLGRGGGHWRGNAAGPRGQYHYSALAGHLGLDPEACDAQIETWIRDGFLSRTGVSDKKWREGVHNEYSTGLVCNQIDCPIGTDFEQFDPFD